MPTVALQQVSSAFARENADKTLHKAIGLKYVRRYLDSSMASELEVACEKSCVYVWGSKLERSHQTYKILDREALVLFRRGASVYKYGVVLQKTTSEPLAESLWGRDTDGETWPTVYFFARIKDKLVPAARINQQLGRSPKDNWQGLVVLTMKESAQVSEFFAGQLEGL
jgi:hypothetical protein